MAAGGHVMSVKFTDEEWEQLGEFAERERVYKHGAVKISVRVMMGLPVPSWAATLMGEQVEKAQERTRVATTR